MRQHFQGPLFAAAACAVFALVASGPAGAQNGLGPADTPSNAAGSQGNSQDNANAGAQENSPANGPRIAPRHSLDYNPAETDAVNQVTDRNILQTPLVNIVPGAVSVPSPPNPMANDPDAAQRGMKYFEAMNCVGCHAPNGAGGMGPTLSDASTFKFGSEPARLYAVISHGAPLGMPAWGSVLPNNVIWDIIAYIESINNDPTSPWGHTVSAENNAPSTEQVPAEFKQSTNPWNDLEKFSNGKKPTQHNPSSAKDEPSNAGSQ